MAVRRSTENKGNGQLACSTFTCGGAMLLFQSPEEAKEGIFLPFLGLTLLVEGEDASQVIEGLYLLHMEPISMLLRW